MKAEEHPAVAVIRQFYVAFARGDVAAAQAAFAADALWHVPGRSLIAGDHRGWESIARNFLNKLRELSNGTFTVELVDVLVGETWLAAFQHATAGHPADGYDRSATPVEHAPKLEDRPFQNCPGEVLVAVA